MGKGRFLVPMLFVSRVSRPRCSGSTLDDTVDECPETFRYFDAESLDFVASWKAHSSRHFILTKSAED